MTDNQITVSGSYNTVIIMRQEDAYDQNSISMDCLGSSSSELFHIDFVIDQSCPTHYDIYVD
ncbi:hypothetical protein CAXC1_30017 [Candidatus Xenohaliotis californiensis]|uniref:Uncharacterized protein n=1 Tax=Candidatus Xenohaliotis californiensis TaxID=84677 RepID=A0ABP0ETZ6_9RICK|nr:hypothetical protein CAXC1_30017 [Candidatus Xenohaliotis californiensis]